MAQILVVIGAALFLALVHGSLAITATLRLALLPPMLRFAIALLRFPQRPAPPLCSAVLAAVPRQGPGWTKPLPTVLEQTQSRPRTTPRPFCSSMTLIYEGFCRILIWAHGRWCSQKLMSRGGCLDPLRGALSRELPPSNLV